jgi:PAS domain S-box-containing protein
MRSRDIDAGDMTTEADRPTLRVLLVEDDEADHILTRECLREVTTTRMQLVWASTGARGLAEMTSGQHDVCLLDHRLGPVTGVELLQRARREGWRGPTILLTGQEDDSIDHLAQQAGAADFLQKSQLTPTLLERTIRYALQHSRTLEALRRSQASFRELIEHLPEAVCVVHARKLVYINTTGARLFGYDSAEPLLGMTVEEIESYIRMSPEEWHQLRVDVRESTRGGLPTRPRETVLVRKDGGTAPAEAVHLPLLFEGHRSHVWLVRDLTERKQMEARLLRADRMGSLGLLAAGVAHEINNPLAYTLANLDLLEEHLRPHLAGFPDGAEVSELLAETRLGASRVRDIVRQLKMFSRGDEDSGLGAVELHRVLETSIGMAVNELKHRARLVRDYGEPVQVEAHEGRLGQVLLNLLVNAAHAIPEGRVEGNEIRLVTRVEGAHVRIEVRDTGVGIRAEHLARVFEPFFTTKPVGVGTGLGLSICHDIVTGFGGRMGVESQEGKGTTFWILLKTRGAQAPVEAPRASAVPPPSRRGRVLVVDDEPMIGTAIRRTLQHEHEVVVLTSAREAFARLVAGEHFDVILCDVMMPEMSGVDLHQQLTLFRPALVERIVFLSGGTFTPNAHAFLGQVKNARLDKPFASEELHAVVRARLAR